MGLEVIPADTGRDFKIQRKMKKNHYYFMIIRPQLNVKRETGNWILKLQSDIVK